MFMSQTPEMLRVTLGDVVETASLLMTNVQVEDHKTGSVTAKSVKWLVVNSAYGSHHILTTLVLV